MNRGPKALKQGGAGDFRRKRCSPQLRRSRLNLGVFVILADDVADLNRGFRIEIDELKSRVLLVREAQARVHVHADVFRRFVDGEAINLFVFAIALLRLHHEAAAGQLPQHAGLAVFCVQHQHLRLRGDVDTLKPPALFTVLHLFGRLHRIISVNTLTGSMSTGTSFTFASADFNSAGMESYFLNHCSARFLSPVASISSSSLARVAMACGIFVKSIAYFEIFGSKAMAPCSAR